MSRIVSVVTALGLFAVAAPVAHQGMDDAKVEKTVRKGAHFFALIASKVLRRESSRGNAGTPGGFGQAKSGGRAWNNARTYAGMLTPAYEGRLYVVGAATIEEGETFEHVRVHFLYKPGRGYAAEYLGQDRISQLLVFRLDKHTRLGRSFRRPHDPPKKPSVGARDRVVSLGHPYVPDKRTWVNWQMRIGLMRDPPLAPAPKHWPLFKLGKLLRHETNFGRYDVYWHGGPLVRVDEDKGIEILGININSMQGVQRALPYAKLIEIRNRVIAEQKPGGKEEKDAG